jgi:hypothetical protein
MGRKYWQPIVFDDDCVVLGHVDCRGELVVTYRTKQRSMIGEGFDMHHTINTFKAFILYSLDI